MPYVFPGPTTTARASTGLMHALFGLVTTSAGWIMIGIGLLIGGFFWGLNSQQVSYNNWPYASLLIGAGILCAGCPIFLAVRARKRQKLAAAAERAALDAIPSPFARELAKDEVLSD